MHPCRHRAAGSLAHRAALALALAGALAAAGSAAQAALADGAAAASDGVDVLDYAVALEPDLAAGRLTGEVAVTFASAGATVLELDAHGLAIEAVTEDGETLRWEAAGGRLRIALPGASRSGERTVRIRYSARPERGLHLAAERAYTAFHTDHWMPCRMDPADKATATLTVTLPAELDVVGPGRRVAREEAADGRARHVFRLDRPHSAYLLGFAAGRLVRTSRRVGEVELELAGEGFDAGEIERVFADIEAMLDFFTARAGVPFRAAAYRQVLLEGAPPQELATMALLPAGYGRARLADPREDYLVAHELAHEWWGNALTARDWSHFWLHEGTVTYLVAAWKEHHWGREAYERERVLARQRYARSRAAEPTRRLVPEGPVAADDAGGAVPYSLGMLVLHLLRVELGDAAFADGLAAFTRGGVAAGLVDTGDLQAALEAASGRGLGAFFATWVHAVPPRLNARHRVESGEAGDTVVVVVESHGGGPVALRVAVETADARLSRRVEVTAGGATETRFAVDGPVLSVRVDDGGHLPIAVDHPRPIEMLRRQVAGEPDLPGRAEALLALVVRCQVPSSPGAAEAGCGDLAAFLAAQADAHSSRLVRELASRELARLSEAP